MNVLVVNAGSSSLKLRLLDDAESVVATADVDAPLGQVDTHALQNWVSSLPQVHAVGHRFVHGGTQFTSATRLDPAVLNELERLTPLAPLHQPPALAAARALAQTLPDAPAIACFDTAFHATLPPAAYTYPVPQEWIVQYGVRRYGFHGLSHEYAAGRTAELVGEDVNTLRLVTCHLGAGASLAAIVGGVSIDTTMGFTPLEGVVMANRSGSVDPGLVLWMQQQAGLSADDVHDALTRSSGLRALAGVPDMRAVATAADNGDPRAALALDVYRHRLLSGIAAMVSSAGGVDALVFTGGIGENSDRVRAETVERLRWLGAELDSDRNIACRQDGVISADDATVRVVVVRAREELQISREVRALIG